MFDTATLSTPLSFRMRPAPARQPAAVSPSAPAISHWLAAALDDPDWAASLAARYPGKVALGLDVRGREVAVRGWVEGSGRQLADVAAHFDDAGFAALIVTQINVDGAGTGPDLYLYAELLESVETDVIASGGVGNATHVRSLAGLGLQSKPLIGAIVGKALYDGSMTIDDALAAAQSA